mgnify:CR=1 FL=1
MKRIVSFFLAIVLALPLSLGCFAANQEAESAADMLYELGLFQGKGTDADGRPDYALDDVPTRQEAVTMLVRLLGKESEAKSGSWTIPFTDVAAWAAPYVGCAYANGLTTGVSASAFDGGSAVTAAQYITFVLRALGYRSGTDFQWNTSWKLSDSLGITDLRSDKRIDFVGGIRGLGELKHRVDSGEMALALALYPVTMQQIIDIADSGNIMPPKTTWFEPKLRSGLIIHKLS